ncbi:MAG: polyphosphate kinase 2 family protein [Bradyrhizobium sp.]|nr:MAG: polyphosphate kinase 2 family protein [Bradyrhizobium sp.]
MKIDVTPFRVAEDEKVSLADRPTAVHAFYDSKDGYAKALSEDVARLSLLQEHLYRSNRYALLIVLQGMDSAGKDGAIAHVMSGVNPQGCKVVSFKTPTSREAAHDFLWRESHALPERGEIGVFNRSYYEPVLVTRVHPELLAAEGIEAKKDDLGDLWKERLHSIRAFERHLHANETRFVKIFLHISKEEQLRRLLARLDDPDKTWKISPSDAKERSYWKDYRRAYEHALSATSTDDAPWYVVPADDKRNARLIVSQLVINALDDMKLAPPPVDEARKRELKTIREALTKD